MTTTRIILSTVVILFGTVFFIFGGYDDSPGAQGLGLLVVIIAIAGLIRNRKRT